MILSLSDALVGAAASGVRARLMVRATLPDKPVRIAVTTSDPESYVAICFDGHREAYVDNRQQSGPERWDYFHRPREFVDRFVDVYFLRIERSSRVVDVPLLTAVVSIIETYGWTAANTGLIAEAGVDRSAFDAAIRSLSSPEAAPSVDRSVVHG
jgi:hypothetical protein